MSLSKHIVDIDEATFESEVILRSHEVPVVVDFWAPWCGPCRMLSPILERQAIEAGGTFVLAKVNVDDNPALSIRFGVQGIPAVKAFRYGEIAAEFVGAQPESMVQRFIEQLVPSETQQAIEEALSMLGTRHYQEAENAFREVLDKDEANADAALGLVESLLMSGKGREALEILEHFPAGTAWAKAERYKPLAELLVEAGQQEVGSDQDPMEASLHQSARLIERGNLEAAMDGLLGILREDKNYRGGWVKRIMLALFELLGDQDPSTRKYREEMASVLF
ncbi:MAG: tetratricopeptide repeat protein [Chloroflexi bacterium]|nr:tetratricopeptide repeat protein [Chloroflexota bacterium]MCH8338451.1 tetratricopeptide repeat protein [Chloroflexota bacterium]